MNLNELKALIAQGKVEIVINELVEFARKYAVNFDKQILLISSRFHSIKQNKLSGIINPRDYDIEMNSVTNDLLSVIDYIDELKEDKLKIILSENVRTEIDRLALEFEEISRITSAPTRLRMKNNLALKICERLTQSPELINSYLNTNLEGIICGISKKIQMIPNIDDLDILEKIVPNTKSKFTKGTLANAIAEIIYFGEIRLGDDTRIELLLNILRKNADITLLKNVDRVQAALDYLKSK